MNIIYNLNSNRSNFSAFKKKFVGWEAKFGVYDRDRDEVYKRIKCVWKEGKIEHQYHAAVNVKTGDIYLDCQRKKIFAKHLTFVFLRPLYTIVKTLWHVSIIGPLALEIFKTAKGQQSARKGLKNFGISMLDIALTPLCGIAMTITSIAAVILSPFSPNILYKGRDIVGWLERKMHHQENLIEAKIPSLSPCFSPLENIATIHRKLGYAYDQTENNIKKGIMKFAGAQIRFRRDHRALFNDCLRLHPKDQPYISAAALS